MWRIIRLMLLAVFRHLLSLYTDFPYQKMVFAEMNEIEIPYFRQQIPDMDLKQLFDMAVADSKDLNIRPSNDTLLQLYALYKQSIEGDQEAEPPANPFDFVAKAKYDAWVSMKGKSREAAMKEYIQLVEKLKN